ncbi:MAG: DUF3369 domain-containing protein [Bacillota bacterium]
MSDLSDLLFNDNENEEFLFSDKDDNLIVMTDKGDKWKILVVDDEPEVHRITRLVLNRFTFEGRSLEIIDAYSGEEAKKIAREHSDIALILMDVVMEEDDAGLKAVRYIREVLGNKVVRIVLRTGQPGQAPEERVIVDYDINDYKDKTELTSQKLFTELVASLRAYRDISTIETNRAGLRKIMDSYETIFQFNTVKDYTMAVLKQFAEILQINSKYSSPPSGFAAIINNGDFYIVSAVGVYEKVLDKHARGNISEEIINELVKAYEAKCNLYYDNKLIIYLKSKTGTESLIYFEDYRKLSMLDKGLIEVFSTNISAINESILNRSRYEAEKDQRQLTEALHELTQELTSTFNLEEVVDRLMACMHLTIPCEGTMVVMNDRGRYKLYECSGFCKGIRNDIIMKGSYEFSVLEMLEDTKKPLLISDVYNCLYLLKDSYCEDEMRSLLAVPIVHQEEMLGAILLWRQEEDSFKRKEKDLAETFINQAVVAVVNAKLFNEVAERKASVKNLLNNAGQGFMSIGEDLYIDDEYSIECERLFGRKLIGMRITELLFMNEDKGFWEGVLKSIFSEAEASKREIIMSLLPREIIVNTKNVELDYKIIHNGSITNLMIILTDVTDKKKLEKDIDRERKILQMVVNTVKHHDDFINTVKDYQVFCKAGINEVVSCSHSTESAIVHIFRSVHTYKGTFSQLGIVNITDKLHELETYLLELKSRASLISKEELLTIISSFDMVSWIKNDLETLNNILGEQFVYQDRIITVQQSKLMEIEEKLYRLGGGAEYSEILSDIKRLRYKPFKEMLKPYAEYVASIAERMEKLIKPFDIVGGEFEVDNEKYSSFVKSLVHVFRNAVDHGLEVYDERLSAGKEESGTIKCSVNMDNCAINICIADDGKGLNIEDIKRKALEKTLIDEEKAQSLSDGEITMLIFEDEFSTSSDATEFSGRGFGLSAVKHEVDKLGGSIWVNTVPGKGAEFNFRIPYEE